MQDARHCGGDTDKRQLLKKLASLPSSVFSGASDLSPLTSTLPCASIFTCETRAISNKYSVDVPHLSTYVKLAN